MVEGYRPEQQAALFNSAYGKTNIDGIVRRMADVDAFLNDVAEHDGSWAALYSGDFRRRLQGRRVLELGCGKGHNALAMAALGAEVTATEISSAAIDVL